MIKDNDNNEKHNHEVKDTAKSVEFEAELTQEKKVEVIDRGGGVPKSIQKINKDPSILKQNS